MADSQATSAVPEDERRASTSDWIAVVAGALGALMATLDISITNSALPQIQGEIGATGSEGTWISTGYLMSEIVMIPLAAWLTRVFGLRNFLVSTAVLFTVFSVLCGLSHNLPEIIAGRIGQGFTGGAMIPTAQTIIRMRLPRKQLPVGMSIFGLIVLIGPLLGPVVGGWLAENISWTWCFFINLPVCAALVVLLLAGLDAEKPQWATFIKADWLGIVGLAVGLSSLTVVLEEGQRNRWFESSMIVWLTVLTAVGMILIAISQFVAKKPMLRLSLLRNARYASVIFIVFAVGMGLYCISYLLPQFLSNIAGYNAEQSGFVLLLSGVPAFLMMPLLPRLLGTVDARVMVIAGLVLFGMSCMLDTSMTAQSVGHNFLWSQLMRGVGQMLAMLPLNQASMAAVSTEEAGDASGLYNMARNLGGSVGLALVGIFLDRRTTLHDDNLREAVTANGILANERIANSTASFMAQGSDATHAHMQALGQLAQQIHVQALVITYSQTFYLLGMALLVCIPLALLLKSPKPGGPAPVSSGH
ncbi:MDR family MFS transporter [Robbsia sp. Bb-Pol-6]|uniref:MDR family MFS transporter n=1 Tax=Robbsia betulipollinis TaxID=2981849 RepID=A0ABT3ZLQ1_9BURK|nr:MDR family MFS transporter [Robbsia betulipollinis]MCY0387473.1 MDR family MFS transporter [Robbsia betulipollinis]